VGHLVVAPDKFRGTATATAITHAVVGRVQRSGWSADAAPMADGGEGLIEVLGGTPVTATVTGPDGAPVRASWSRLAGEPMVAVVEAAAAAGLELAGGPTGNRPLEATTRGVGELVLAAVDAGARRIVLGCGGSATTDGGLGALQAIGGVHRLHGAEIVVACDVTTRFLDAARVFGPQKGAGAEMVPILSARLGALAERYRAACGVDVTAVPGGGAAGGLAGGMVTVGAHLVGGAALVADLLGLTDRLQAADLVVTGEGHLDATSAAGKVVHEVIARTPPATPVLCVVGDADPETLSPDGRTLRALADRPAPVRVVRLAVTLGPQEARRDTPQRIADAVHQAVEEMGRTRSRLARTGRRRAS